MLLVGSCWVFSCLSQGSGQVFFHIIALLLLFYLLGCSYCWALAAIFALSSCCCVGLQLLLFGMPFRHLQPWGGSASVGSGMVVGCGCYLWQFMWLLHFLGMLLCSQGCSMVGVDASMFLLPGGLLVCCWEMHK